MLADGLDDQRARATLTERLRLADRQGSSRGGMPSGCRPAASRSRGPPAVDSPVSRLLLHRFGRRREHGHQPPLDPRRPRQASPCHGDPRRQLRLRLSVSDVPRVRIIRRGVVPVGRLPCADEWRRHMAWQHEFAGHTPSIGENPTMIDGTLWGNLGETRGNVPNVRVARRGCPRRGRGAASAPGGRQATTGRPRTLPGGCRSPRWWRTRTPSSGDPSA